MAAPWVGGVCSGVAHYFGISVVPVRIATVALTALGGLGFFIYMALWILTPTEPQAQYPTSPEESATGGQQAPYRAPLRQVGTKRTNQTTAGRLFLIGIVFLALALVLLVGGSLPYVNVPVVFWSALIILGLFLTWTQVPKLTTERTGSVIAFAALGVGMVLVGAFLILAEYELLPQVSLGLLVGFVTIAGIVVALLPLGLKTIRDLSASRASEARETERAEIAAHLHDSVLQTLTLIRGAADDPARVRALALTQERELRAWLYTGETTPEVSAAQALRNQASNIETTYGTPIEVVTVGDGVPGPSDLAAIAAAAEAMTNAVRHGKPPITVFQEVRGKTLEIFVKDAGEGFDTENIPANRHGFRNSIKGRVERVGGQVSVRILSTDGANGGGTEVEIKVPRQG